MSNPDDAREVVEIGARAIAGEIDCVDWTAPDNTMSHAERLDAIARDAARAILTAIEASGRWKIVPVEPSDAMLEAGGSSIIRPSIYMGGTPPGAKRRARDVWADMLRAALSQTDGAEAGK
jgi:hypothetical protein